LQNISSLGAAVTADQEVTRAVQEQVAPAVQKQLKQAFTRPLGSSSASAPASESEDDADWQAALQKLIMSGVKKGVKEGELIGDDAKMKAAEQRLKFLNKPPDFDGTGNFVEWRDKMDHFMSVLNLPSSEEVPVATSYLRGGALSWWKTEFKRQQQDVYERQTEDRADLLDLMNARYDHLNPVLSARSKLQTLKQGSMSLQQYLTEFESCYAHIPIVDEEDRIFRFTFNMRSDLQERFAVNPLTQKRWDNWSALVTYVSAFLSDASCAELRQQASKNTNGAGSSAGTGGGGGNGNPGLRAKGGVKKPNRGNPPPRRPARDVSANTTKAMASGTVSRSYSEWGFCLAHGICYGCYQKGHQVANCPGPKANGQPPNYTHDWVQNLSPEKKAKFRTFIVKA
jgi:hypothetical protein